MSEFNFSSLLGEEEKEKKPRSQTTNSDSNMKKIKALESQIHELTKIVNELTFNQDENTNSLPGTMEMALHLKDYIFKNNIPSFNANDPKFRLGPIVYLIDMIKDLYKGKMI